MNTEQSSGPKNSNVNLIFNQNGFSTKPTMYIQPFKISPLGSTQVVRVEPNDLIC